VLVVGPEEHPGLNGLKKFISEIDKKGDWIKPVFRTHVSKEVVSSNVGVVLTMTSIKHGTLANMRLGARDRGACCPQQALLPGEVKDILGILQERRRETAATAETSNASRVEVTFSPAGAIEVLRRRRNGKSVEALPAQPPEETNEVSAPSQLPPTIVAQKEPDDFDKAIVAIETFGSAFDEVQSAILVVAGSTMQVAKERDELKNALAEKEAQIIELMARLQGAQKDMVAKAELERENEELRGKVTELESSLENLQGLIAGALKRK
jgi:hypothetical protein